MKSWREYHAILVKFLFASSLTESETPRATAVIIDSNSNTPQAPPLLQYFLKKIDKINTF
jgi:hypothetical protein